MNAVALKGVNEADLGEMVAWAGDQGFDMTIIEVMPMGDIGNEIGLTSKSTCRYHKYEPICLKGLR